MSINIIAWLVLLVAFITFEAMTTNLVSIWFCIGSLFAITVATVGGSLTLQLILFVLTSGLSILTLRPIAKKYITPKITKTNVDSLVGKTARVVEPVDWEKGTVKVDGLIWSARTEDEDVADVDSLVTIVQIEGVKLIIKTQK